MKRSTAILLTLAIFVALAANSADFFFRTPYYETWDTAANALSVIRAKHFEQLYGPYSRWGFYHPGPVLFYIQALGEWLFFDVWRLTPAPYNAQTLLYLLVAVSFLIAALRVFARWLPRGRSRQWFLCAALGLAALHFTHLGNIHSYEATAGPDVFFSMWSAHALVLPFLCLLAAGASVAAGEGADLPLLALAAGYLLQTHVAQPLFVFPLTALAMAGLIWRCAHDELGDFDGALLSPGRMAVRRLTASGRAFPSAHLLAAMVLAFFALPLVIDLARGGGNLEAIVQHLRTHRGEHKTLERSVDYFLQFGAYGSYRPETFEFGEYTAAGMAQFLRAHGLILTFWAASLLAALWALSGAARKPELIPGDLLSEGWALRGVRPERQRFLAWAATFLLAAISLTLRWGVVQDGQMFYYNAWFNFAIYYFGALIALAVLIAWVLGWSKVAAAAPTGGRERLAGLMVVGLIFIALAGRLRVRDADPAKTAAFHEDVARALALTAPAAGAPPALRLLSFPVDLWVTVAGVALEMERLHQPVYVSHSWAVTFGLSHIWEAMDGDSIGQRGVQNWQFVCLPGQPAGLAQASPGGAKLIHITAPVLYGQASGREDCMYVRLNAPALDPSADGGARIDLVAGGNARDFAVGGWSDGEPGGCWSDGRHAVLAFQAVPAPEGSAGVDVTFVSVNPLVAPDLGVRAQRLSIFFNGEPLGGENRLDKFLPALTFRISADRWNRAAKAPVGGSAILELALPDAVSPAALDPQGPNKDARVLGVALQAVEFHVAPPPVAN